MASIVLCHVQLLYSEPFFGKLEIYIKWELH